MLRFFRRHIAIPLLERRRGVAPARYLREVERFLGQSRAELDQAQELKFRLMVKHAWETVPFYKRHYAPLGDAISSGSWDNIQELLPPVSKADIRKNQTRLISQAYSKQALRQSATGGTTDSPLTIYMDYESLSKRLACTRYFMRWYGYSPGDRIAYLWGATRDFPERETPRSRLLNYLSSHSLFLPASPLDGKTLTGYIERLRQFRPKVLQAYPTPLYTLAQHMLATQSSLDIPNITVTAEPLLPAHRSVIERAFQRKVFNWYGARELGHAASECKQHSGLHMNSYGLLFEVQTPSGSIERSGHGELLLTDLDNLAMPLVRYRIGDFGEISRRPCPCGSSLPILETITGRTADILVRPDGSIVPGVTLTNRIIKSNEAIDQLQIVQVQPNRFLLRIVKGDSFSPSAVETIKSTLEELMDSRLDFGVEFHSDLPKEASGKTRFVISEVTHPATPGSRELPSMTLHQPRSEQEGSDPA